MMNQEYTLPIIRYTYEIWKDLYPQATMSEWRQMSNLHSSADAASVHFLMAQQSGKFSSKKGSVRFLTVDQEFFQWRGMTISEWMQTGMMKRANDMQQYLHQLSDADLKRLMLKNHMDQDLRVYVYRFRTQKEIPTSGNLPQKLKKLLGECLSERAGKLNLYLPGFYLTKDFTKMGFTPSEFYQDFLDMAAIYLETGVMVRKGKYRFLEESITGKALGEEIQIPFVLEHPACVSASISSLFASPFQSAKFPETLRTVLAETFGEIQMPQIIRILDLPDFVKQFPVQKN